MTPDQPATVPPDDNARIYKCVDCGTMFSKAEGGTVFSCCETCMEKRYPPTPKPPVPTPPSTEEALTYGLRLKDVTDCFADRACYKLACELADAKAALEKSNELLEWAHADLHTKETALAAERALADRQREYIEYLHKADMMSSGFLYAHNWKHDPELIEHGNLCRERIAAAHAEARKGRPSP